MTPGLMSLILYVVTAVVMLFQLRSLMQSSSADFYNPVTQVVYKMTSPVVNMPGLRTMRMGSFFIGGILVSVIIGYVFWLVMSFVFRMPFSFLLLGGLFLAVKTFGYLLIILLLAQALTSWLPATQRWSYFFGQITSPVVSPVQKVIPPIGMIDISLMIILLGLYFLNSGIYKLLAAVDRELFFLWALC